MNVEPSSPTRPASRPAGRLVGVVEDDQVIRGVIAEVLEEQGFRVAMAADGSQALEMLDRELPDVLVLDLLMPVMHGWAFMESYLDKTHGAPIPIVVVSVNPIVPRSFDRFGVRHCIGKPFQLDELVDAVEGALDTVAA